MRKLSGSILGISFAIAFIVIIAMFAKMRNENLLASIPVSGRISQLGALDEVEPEARDARIARAKINPEPGEVFLDSLDINLDTDEDLEQVIVVHDASSQDKPLSIVVADFQPLTGSHFRTWKGNTRATVARAFVVQPRDFDGDGIMEILCHGIDGENLQTLDIFGTASSSLSGLRSIFSESGLVLELDEGSATSRTDTASAAASIRLIPAADSSVERRYDWNPGSRSFRLADELPRKAFAVDPEYASTILTGDPDDFSRFLDGLWRRSPPDGSGDIFIGFDPVSREITLSGPGDQQIWSWEVSSNAYLGIYAPISNATVPELVRLLTIELSGVDRIRVRSIAQQSVRFAASEPWNGEYERVVGRKADTDERPMKSLDPGEIFSMPARGGAESRELRLSDLEGSYRALDGSTFHLAGSMGRLEFSAKNGALTIEGQASMLLWNGLPLIDIMPARRKDAAAERKTYFVSASFTPSGGIATLRLERARIVAERAEPAYEPAIDFFRTDTQGTR